MAAQFPHATSENCSSQRRTEQYHISSCAMSHAPRTCKLFWVQLPITRFSRHCAMTEKKKEREKKETSTDVFQRWKSTSLLPTAQSTHARAVTQHEPLTRFPLTGWIDRKLNKHATVRHYLSVIVPSTKEVMISASLFVCLLAKELQKLWMHCPDISTVYPSVFRSPQGDSVLCQPDQKFLNLSQNPSSH